MIGKGYFKDFYSQEFLEELVRLTKPGTKINNIVPFTKYVSDDWINQANTVYFCQIHNGITPIQMYLNGKLHPIVEQDRSGFLLFDNITNQFNGVVSGWQIILENIPIDIYSGTVPPAVKQTGIITSFRYWLSKDSLNDVGTPQVTIQANWITTSPVSHYSTWYPNAYQTGADQGSAGSLNTWGISNFTSSMYFNIHTSTGSTELNIADKKFIDKNIDVRPYNVTSLNGQTIILSIKELCALTIKQYNGATLLQTISQAFYIDDAFPVTFSSPNATKYLIQIIQPFVSTFSFLHNV